MLIVRILRYRTVKNAIERRVKIRRVNKVEYLILSSTIDYSTDYICIELEKRGYAYLRLNRDVFSEYKIIYSIEDRTMRVQDKTEDYVIDGNTLRAIYFRAPVFVRNGKTYPLEKQLYRSQWSSFLRNLIVFERAVWINHPVATYRAENKMFQLKKASEIGFSIPRTWIANSVPAELQNNEYIVKALDTPLFYEKNDELFTYSSIIEIDELKSASLEDAPVIMQELLRNKIDIRVTVVGNDIYPVQILANGSGIEGDWRRLSKDELSYIPITLPDRIQEKIRAIMKTLDLKFAGIDLAVVGNQYYFIEVNPTGEWGWLVRTADLPIDKSIVDLMNERDQKSSSRKNNILLEMRDAIFPIYDDIKLKRKLKKRLEKDDIDTVLNTVSNPVAVNVDTLKESLEYEKNRKDKFEDKAKVNVIGVTLAISLIMGTSDIIGSIRSIFPGEKYVIIIVLALGVLYMLLAGITVIEVLINENEFYSPPEDKIKNQFEIDKCIGQNRIKNMIRNNAVYTSYECIRNGLICLFMIFCLMLLPTVVNSDAKATEMNTIGGYDSCYSSASCKNQRLIENKVTLLDKDIATDSFVNKEELFIKYQVDEVRYS